MKIVFLTLFIMFLTVSVAQTTYNSSHTVHIPSQIVEDIPRTLTVSKDHEYILIKSYKHGQLVDSQLWVIKNIIDELNYDGLYKLYECKSPDGSYPTMVHIKQRNPQYITILQPSVYTTDVYEYNLIIEVLN